MAIRFYFTQDNYGSLLRNRRGLKSFLNKYFVLAKKPVKSLNYIFESDQELLEINRDFLQHDFYTDIVTFNLSSTHLIEGEVYISIDRVKENALQLNLPVEQELHRVIFHGALHLCGYKDDNPRHKKQMTSLENLLLKEYFQAF